MMLIRMFNYSLQKRPMLTQVIASGVISAGGDVMSQFVFEKRKLHQYDWKRTGRFFVLASCFIAPVVGKWFKILESRVHIGPQKLRPLVRVAADQILMAPFINAGVLIVLRGLEGFSLEECIKKMKEDWWAVYSKSLMLWPIVQTVNFYYVPLNFRVILVQLVALFWNCYLSFKTQAKLEDPQLQKY